MSNSTVNRTLEVVRAVLRKAANEWEWLHRVPKVHEYVDRVQRAPSLRVVA